MEDKAFKLTKLGKKKARSIIPDGRNKILDFLLSHAPAYAEDVGGATGMSKYTALVELRQLERKGLVMEYQPGRF